METLFQHLLFHCFLFLERYSGRGKGAGGGSSGTVCTRHLMHTRISGEYAIKNRWLRSLLSCFADKNHIKISREYTAKRRWLKSKNGVCARQPTHTKISGEYVIRKRWLRSKTGTHRKVEGNW